MWQVNKTRYKSCCTPCRSILTREWQQPQTHTCQSFYCKLIDSPFKFPIRIPCFKDSQYACNCKFSILLHCLRRLTFSLIHLQDLCSLSWPKPQKIIQRKSMPCSLTCKLIKVSRPSRHKKVSCLFICFVYVTSGTAEQPIEGAEGRSPWEASIAFPTNAIPNYLQANY